MSKYKYIAIIKLSSIVLFLSICVNFGCNKEAPAKEPKTMAQPEKTLIDDFSSDASKSVTGRTWTFISDQVMGGVSTGKMEFIEHDSRSCLHMNGDVSLKNRGGFIQVRSNLNPKGKTFDASSFDGIYLRVKGNNEPYALHLRTSNTWFPWQHYQAMFRTDGTWQEIKVAFEQFEPVSLKKPLNRKKLKTIAIVAIKKEFKADIYIDEIGFYKEQKMYKKLTPEEERVIIHKGTERPFSGKFDKHYETGTYTCKRCGAELFKSTSKFKSGCGWPSFDDQIPGTVKSQTDADGIRTEITCAQCGGHLGHVFLGEGFTPKNARYCVNSISLDFISPKINRREKAIFASGCFWGTEYHLQKVPGVISTTVGYTGGHVDNPTYEQVCTDKTGHAEAVQVVYDSSKTTYEQLAKLFFETHNFTQINRQGPDVGTQYRSAIFYLSEEQKEVSAKLVDILKKKGHDVQTKLVPAGKFWPAEKYHQDYYKKAGKTPYCHFYKKIF